MQRNGDEIEISGEEASGGVKGHHVRYVLAISMALAILVMSLAWIVPALMR